MPVRERLESLLRHNWPRCRASSRVPVVVPSVPMDDARKGWIKVVERIQVDRYEVAAQFGEGSLAEAKNMAACTEEPVCDLGGA